MATLSPAAVPRRRLGVWHAVSVCVGMVVGAGIFKSAPLAAQSIPSDLALLAAWVFGGVMSLAGALCFAELAGAFPDPGGDYFFLRKAYGDGVGFLFAWSRFAVIHTGSMAMLAFSFGDYLAEIVDLGANGSAAIGAATIVALAGLNLVGLRIGIGMQALLVIAVIMGLLLVGAAGALHAFAPAAVTGGAIAAATAVPAGAAAAHGPLQLGAGLVYVFLAYGGWSDTATLSAEMRDGDHGIKRALVIGMSLVTGLYLLANWAYVQGLSIDGLAASNAPAADLALLAFGKPGQLAIVAIVAVTSITSMNAILIAGSRTTFAAARDTASLEVLRRWHIDRGTPSRAIVAITLVSLALLAFGALTRGGFATMVDYLSPVYWLFLTLSGVALIVLRRREPNVRRPFRVPGYPLVPLAFIASSVYVFWSSVAYVRVGAVVGVAVLVLGGLLLAALRRASSRSPI
ncbi:MAG TPA: amino acid permease [Gammaproteobacteria bacterium]|nr:amino acid permease [Gammaproteobacteria bacterium]